MDSSADLNKKTPRKICPHCGTKLVASSKFCMKCGSNVVHVPVIEQDTIDTIDTTDTADKAVPINTTSDNSQSTQSTQSTQFMQSSQTTQSTQSSQSSQAKKSKKYIPIVAACLAILVIVIGIFNFTHNNPKNDNKNPNTDSSETKGILNSLGGTVATESSEQGSTSSDKSQHVLTPEEEQNLKLLALDRMEEFFNAAFEGDYKAVKEYLPPKIIEYFENSSDMEPGVLNQHIMRICAYYSMRYRKNFRNYDSIKAMYIDTMTEPPVHALYFNKYSQPYDEFYAITINLEGTDEDATSYINDQLEVICFSYDGNVYFDPYSISYLGNNGVTEYLFGSPSYISFELRTSSASDGNQDLINLGANFLQTIFNFDLEKFYTFMPSTISELAQKSTEDATWNPVNAAYNICYNGVINYQSILVDAATGQKVNYNLKLGPDTPFSVDTTKCQIIPLTSAFEEEMTNLYNSVGLDFSASSYTDVLYPITLETVEGNSVQLYIDVISYEDQGERYISLYNVLTQDSPKIFVGLPGVTPK